MHVINVACDAGQYRSALNNSCVFCPGNSTSTIAETECSCISGHYRAHYEGLGISCTGNIVLVSTRLIVSSKSSEFANKIFRGRKIILHYSYLSRTINIYASKAE